MIAMNENKKWGVGILVIEKDGPIVYDTKQGRQVDIRYESTSNQASSEDTTILNEEPSSYKYESLEEVMGLVFNNKKEDTTSCMEYTTINDPKLEEKIKRMLADDLTKEEE